MDDYAMHVQVIQHLPAETYLGGTHSRSKRHLSHLGIESSQRLKPCEAFNRSTILDPITEELTQDLDLLARKVLGREGCEHGGKVGDSLPPDIRIFIVDVLTERLDQVEKRDLPILQFFFALKARTLWSGGRAYSLRCLRRSEPLRVYGYQWQVGSLAHQTYRFEDECLSTMRVANIMSEVATVTSWGFPTLLIDKQL